MPIRYVRVDLKPVRIETRHVFVPPPPPLPMRARPALAAPAPRATFGEHYRAVQAASRLRAAQRRDAETAPPVTPADLVRARKEIAGRSQRDLAAEFGCARSLVAEAERGRRTALPAIARWTAGTLAAQALRDAERAEPEGEEVGVRDEP